VADGALAQESFGEGGFGAYVVAVAASVTFLDDVAGVDKVLDDTKSGAFGHIDRSGDLTQPNARVRGDTQQSSRMAGEKSPGHICRLGHIGKYFHEIIC